MGGGVARRRRAGSGGGGRRLEGDGCTNSRQAVTRAVGESVSCTGTAWKLDTPRRCDRRRVGGVQVDVQIGAGMRDREVRGVGTVAPALNGSSAGQGPTTLS